MMFTVELFLCVCANLALTSSYDNNVITTVAVQMLWFFLTFRVPSKTLHTLTNGPDKVFWSRQPMSHIRGWTLPSSIVKGYEGLSLTTGYSSRFYDLLFKSYGFLYGWWSRVDVLIHNVIPTSTNQFEVYSTRVHLDNAFNSIPGVRDFFLRVFTFHLHEEVKRKVSPDWLFQLFVWMKFNGIQLPVAYNRVYTERVTLHCMYFQSQEWDNVGEVIDVHAVFGDDRCWKGGSNSHPTQQTREKSQESFKTQKEEKDLSKEEKTELGGSVESITEQVFDNESDSSLDSKTLLQKRDDGTVSYSLEHEHYGNCCKRPVREQQGAENVQHNKEFKSVRGTAAARFASLSQKNSLKAQKVRREVAEWKRQAEEERLKELRRKRERVQSIRLRRS